MANPGSYSNWLGVLRWSLKQSDGTHESTVKPLSEEDKAFLQKVFDEMSVDETKLMSDITRKLVHKLLGVSPVLAKCKAYDPAADTESEAKVMVATFDDMLNRLEELQDIAGSIDNGKNFVIIGAFQAHLELLRVGPESIVGEYTIEQKAQLQGKVADVIATALQNNPKGQGWALECDALLIITGKLLSCLWDGAVPRPVASFSKEHLQLTASVISALSALSRDNADAERQLVNPCLWLPGTAPRPVDLVMLPVCQWREWTNGAPPLPTRTYGKRLVRKCLFFLRHLVASTSADATKGWLCGAGGTYIDALLRVLQHPSGSGSGSGSGGVGVIDESEDVDARENALAVLHELTLQSEVKTGIIDDSDKRRGPSGKQQIVLPVGQVAATASTAAAVSVNDSTNSAPVTASASTSSGSIPQRGVTSVATHGSNSTALALAPVSATAVDAPTTTTGSSDSVVDDSSAASVSAGTPVVASGAVLPANEAIVSVAGSSSVSIACTMPISTRLRNLLAPAHDTLATLEAHLRWCERGEASTGAGISDSSSGEGEGRGAYTGEIELCEAVLQRLRIAQRALEARATGPTGTGTGTDAAGTSAGDTVTVPA